MKTNEKLEAYARDIAYGNVIAPWYIKKEFRDIMYDIDLKEIQSTPTKPRILKETEVEIT